MRLSELQQEIDRWIGQFEEGYWPPLANMARLTEELGELARAVNRVHGPKKAKADEAQRAIADEMGDILFTLCAMANSMGISLEDAAQRTMEKVETRDAARWTRRRPTGE
jgi:NTP pyrophosphatase (non-canonical NTP hydrolase)